VVFYATLAALVVARVMLRRRDNRGGIKTTRTLRRAAEG
jgi:hypothetical protein